MPFFKAADKLVYYAHVPKCGGSAIADYLRDRFGTLAFHNNGYSALPQEARWSRTSPQHIDAASLERVIPLSMFDAMFSIVRHPVARLVSSYHFHLEVEKSISPDTSFGDWLTILEGDAGGVFRFDNHTRPMSEIVPSNAKVFRMEDGLDQLVTWFDALTGQEDGPRSIEKKNARGDYGGARGQKVVPTDDELHRISVLYAVDFERFGYELKKGRPPGAFDENRPAHRGDTGSSSLAHRIGKRLRRLLG